MANVKVQNFLNKYRSYITLAAHTDRMLFGELERLFQEMYDLGHADGYADYYYDNIYSGQNHDKDDNDNSSNPISNM